MEDRRRGLKMVELVGKVFGYARVSTKEQCLERQLVSLKTYGVAERDIVVDKMSGSTFNREGYLTLKNRQLRAGDTLVIHELDRLGRSWEDIKKEWQELEAMGVSIVILDQPILNTAGKSDMERKLIANIVLELLAYNAEKERKKMLTRQRQAYDVMPVVDGKKVSLKTGNACGRPNVDLKADFLEVYFQWKKDGKTKCAYEQLGVSKPTFYKLVKNYEATV